MFEGWQRADIISAAAVGIAASALLVALASARYTAIQAGVARRKEREEVKATWPAIEPMLATTSWPGWYRLKMNVRNRLDTTIVCETLRIRAPRNARMILARDAGEPLDTVVVVDEQPPIESLKTEVTLSTIIRRAGSIRRFKDVETPYDVGHVDALVFISSMKASRSPQLLEMSLSVRRSSESVSFAETMVETKIPAVSTSKAT